MNEETRTFISTNLYCEVANTDHKGALDGFKDEWVSAVKRGLAELLVTRELDVHGYEALTDYEFESADEMYEYLAKVYAYVFEDSDERPFLN